MSHKKVNKKRDFERPQGSFVRRACALLATLLLATPAAHAWWDLTWDARVQLTFNNSGQTENLVNFPVLIVLDPSNVDYGLMEANGADLRFVDADDSTLLDHEIESWNPGGTSYVWVRVPTIDGSSSSDFIYLYYDKTGAADVQNAAGVWSNGYLAVWHLDDDPSVSVLDSTVNAKHGTGTSMNSGNVVGGQIGNATRFDGSAEYIRVPSGAGDILEINTANLTIESWVRRNGANPGVWMALVGRQVGDADQPDSYGQLLNSADPSEPVAPINADAAYGGTGSVPDGTWRYLAATKDASFIRQYVSGSEAGQSASIGNVVSDANDVTIGAMENDATAIPSEWFVGDLDEIRISNVTRSADWIAAQHLSMTDTFVTAETCPGGVVTTTIDSLGSGSLRACVIWANSNPGDDTITLPAGTYTLDLVGAGEDDNSLTGDLDINDPGTLLTINGAGARSTTIDGNGTDRIFHIKSDDGDLALSGMTLQNGDAQGNDGGAIENTDNTVTLTDVRLTGNTANKGGAVHVSSGDARVDLIRALVDTNTAVEGGGLFGTGGGTRVNITNTTFTGNTATSKGGAMRVDHVALVNSTIVGNTNTGNATDAGGVYEDSGQVFTATNTIIANNTGDDCRDTYDSGPNNIASDITCGFATVADPKLDALANNGGQTDTMMPQSGSPAIEGGTVSIATVDQRSQPRPDGLLYDVGAVEAVVHELTGKVFEDADFAGTATDFGAGDLALANVDVELYTSTNSYISSTTTDASGDFSFWVVDGNYKVRARSATIGDSNTLPAGTFNAACGITDPASGVACAVAEQTWGNGAAAYRRPVGDGRRHGDQQRRRSRRHLGQRDGQRRRRSQRQHRLRLQPDRQHGEFRPGQPRSVYPQRQRDRFVQRHHGELQ